MDKEDVAKNNDVFTKLKFIGQFCISIICLCWVVYLLLDMDWPSAHRSFKDIKFSFVFFSLLIIVFLYLTRMGRLKYWVSNIQEKDINGMDWLNLYLKSIAFGALTPARIGDFSRIHLLSPTGVTFQNRTKLVFSEKLWDMAYAPVAILLTLYILKEKFHIPVLVSGSVACIIFVVLAVFIIRLSGFLGGKAQWFGLVLTVAGFICYVFGNVFLFQAAGIDLTIRDIIAITTAMGIMASLPISLGGLGVREGTLLVFLQLWGVPREMALPLIYLEFFVNILFPIILYLPIGMIFGKHKTVTDQ